MFINIWTGKYIHLLNQCLLSDGDMRNLKRMVSITLSWMFCWFYRCIQLSKLICILYIVYLWKLFLNKVDKGSVITLDGFLRKSVFIMPALGYISVQILKCWSTLEVKVGKSWEKKKNDLLPTFANFTEKKHNF